MRDEQHIHLAPYVDLTSEAQGFRPTWETTTVKVWGMLLSQVVLANLTTRPI
jgi:hypothetical protein